MRQDVLRQQPKGTRVPHTGQQGSWGCRTSWTERVVSSDRKDSWRRQENNRQN